VEKEAENKKSLKTLLHYKGLMVYLTIMRRGAYGALYPFDLTMLFLLIVAYYNVLVRFYRPSLIHTAINLLTFFILYATARLFFVICESIIHVSEKLLSHWVWKFHNPPYFPVYSPLYQKYVLALKPLCIPCAVVHIDRSFHRHYIFQTNIVAMDSLLILSLQ